MPPTSGSRLGAYEVQSALGVGGMGEVYRAKDTKLGREVALKILPASFTNDPERVARFRREAQVLASLNHPHIAQIHGLEEVDGAQFLVLELVDGESLDRRIARGAIPVDEALGIAKQIAEALEVAHEKGIIHRDLKPANIALTKDGSVKVLDFGLAKAIEPTGGSIDAMNSPTITSPAMMTGVGVILGTAAYMSPEQARGRPADRRSDIWAFGCVLYETLTSRRAFEGEDVSDTLAFILTKEPEWTPLPPETPTSVRRLLRRCLEKDRGRRLADIADARLDLEEGANQVTSAEATPVPRSARHAMLRGGCLGTIAGAAIVATLWLAGSAIRGRSVVEPAVFRSSILLPGAIANFPGSLALSPDGRRVAFVASDTNGRSQLWIRALDGLAAQPLPDTAGALTPFWAADSRWLAFVQNGKLKKIEATGGPAVTLADSAEPFGGGAWNRDDLILFCLPTGSLSQIRAAGGTPTTLAYAKSNPKARTYVPSFLPDGRQFIFTQDGKSPDETQAYIGSLDTTQVTPLPLPATTAQYAAGLLWFLRGSTLMAQPFDPARRTPTGEALLVAEQVRRDSTRLRRGFFSVSAVGTLVYQADRGAGNELTWLDREGQPIGTLGSPGDYDDVRLSPDGHRLLVSLPQANTLNRDLWIVDVERGVRTRLTFGDARAWGGIWSPDGNQVVFSATRGGHIALIQKASNGSGEEQVLLEDEFEKELTDWSSDGRFILYQRRGRTGSDISPWVLPLVGDRKTFPLSPERRFFPQFSPDGHWVAYNSTESGRGEVYVAPFPGPGGRWLISSAGGTDQRWRADGKEILYRGADALWSAAVTLEHDRVDVGEVKRLYNFRKLGSRLTFDVSPDAQRILAITEKAEAAAEPLTLVVNWPALLKK